MSLDDGDDDDDDDNNNNITIIYDYNTWIRQIDFYARKCDQLRIYNQWIHT